MGRGPKVWWLVVLALACYTPRARVRYGSLRIGDREHAYQLGVETWTLPNQLTVAVAPDDRVNLVSVDVRYRVGSAEDPPGKTGLAHLVEHLLFEQTSRRSSRSSPSRTSRRFATRIIARQARR